MNISPHLLIDAGILSAALTIILVLRAKGNAVRKGQEVNDYKKVTENENRNYLGFGIFNLWCFIAIGAFLVYLYSAYIFADNNGTLAYKFNSQKRRFIKNTKSIDEVFGMFLLTLKIVGVLGKDLQLLHQQSL